MIPQKLKVLLVVEQCNPDWFSVPLVGYSFYQGLLAHADITLVTHERNQEALSAKHPDQQIHYIKESPWITRWYGIAHRLSSFRGNIIWPIYLILIYPMYADFNRKVFKQFHRQVKSGHYDIVHAITPMMPRYPVKLVKACEHTPFIIGPVNGGVPYPSGFKEIANKEFAFLNVFRQLGRYLLPGYSRTYTQAAKVLAGSSYTLEMLGQYFSLESKSLSLFFENGIKRSFLKHLEAEQDNSSIQDNAVVNLLFVGRLVPYKGADMLIEALSRLDQQPSQKWHLTIVGDGSERGSLEGFVAQKQLQDKVSFSGWVEQDDTLKYYQKADIFCFPSVREFGGAVVLEAMANGLPCVVVNYGGIGEYINEEVGIKVDPVSREYVIDQFSKNIERLLSDKAERQKLSLAALDYVKSFTWEEKAKKVMDIYNEVLKK